VTNQDGLKDQHLAQWIYRAKIRMLFVNHKHSWVPSLLVSAILASFTIESKQLGIGLVWWLAFLLITLLRANITKQFCNNTIEAKEFPKWHKRFFWASVLAGFGWGVGGLVIGIGLDNVTQVIVLCVLIGVCAAAVPLLGIMRGVMLGFQLPAVIPCLALLILTMEGKAIVLLLVFTIFVVGIVVAMGRVEESIVDSLKIQYKMEKMTDSLKESNKELQDENEKLEHLSFIDSLTQLYNRRYFEVQLEKEWKRKARKDDRLTLLVIDIDYFKLYNDTYGHAEGDVCLQKVAKTLKVSLQRPGDIVARIGGEEFVALLPDIDEEGAIAVANTIRNNLLGAELIHATSPVSEYVTVSIGVALAYSGSDATALGLFKAADKALYKAKNKGRNQIVVGTIDKFDE
jgi:diguanylate cyclase (GGDEF)-like protein